MSLNTQRCPQCEALQNDRDMWHDETRRTRLDLAASRSQCETLRDALAHCAASIDHLMAFKGSRLEETQRDGHLLNLQRARDALATTNPARSSADDCAKP